MLPCRVFNQSIAPTASIFLPGHHLLRSGVRNQSQNPLLSFQSLTHSSQFTKHDIRSIFLALRTLCQKHLGTGSASPAKFSQIALTPTESISFLYVPSNLFRIYLFTNMHLPSSLESISFTKLRGGVGAKLLHYNQTPTPQERRRQYRRS